MLIRKLREKDLSQLAKLYAQFWNEESDVSKMKESLDLIEKEGNHIILVAELEALAKKRECTQMILVTEKNRADACGFYESYGFQTDTTGYKKKCK